jgi:hypothetical protein
LGNHLLDARLQRAFDGSVEKECFDGDLHRLALTQDQIGLNFGEKQAVCFA